jgi:hypothetical protein
VLLISEVPNKRVWAFNDHIDNFKGKFTIVLQEDQRSISEDVEANPQLKQMIRESMEAYKEGRSLTTSELIKTLSPKDFSK